MKIIVPIFVTLGLLFGLTSCAAPNQRSVWQLPGERHKITVVETSDRLNLVVGPGDGGLSLAHKAAIRGFVDAWRNHGHGQMAISIPAGSINAQVAVGAAAQTREILFAEGVAWEQMAGGHYQAPGQLAPPLVLSFRRYTASAQGCSAARDNMAINFSNATSANFGCTVAVNTAAMIADPYDLLAPKKQTKPWSDRRIDIYEKYVAGENTGASRSSDEEGTISDAVD
ncbi:MAG: CpaD family pilus assembly protein [Robiginitomaculum sp.]|nr:CpaD family pilus assembly protein [Robiginitomaculum sp.]